MKFEARLQHHKAAAEREAKAAQIAGSQKVADFHTSLAEIHLRQAARVQSARDALKIAFGD